MNDISARRPVRRVDGNAAGGYLFEAFARDMTAARATCGHCARSAVLADAVAEIDEAGVILLCRGCGRTLLTYVHSDGRAILTVGELVALSWTDEIR